MFAIYIHVMANFTSTICYHMYVTFVLMYIVCICFDLVMHLALASFSWRSALLLLGECLIDRARVGRVLLCCSGVGLAGAYAPSWRRRGA